MGVVVEPAAGNESRQIRADFCKLEAGDESGEVMGVDADIGETGRSAGARRIGAPFRLFLALRVDRLREPFLDIGGVDDAQFGPSSPAAIISLAWRTIA